MSLDQNAIKKVLQLSIQEGLENTSVFMGGAILPNWNNTMVRLLKFLLQERLITIRKVFTLVDNSLMLEAEYSYSEILKGQYPDHTVSPETIAYKLYHSGFTAREEERIQFDHRETRDDFIRTYGGKTLRRQIVRELLTEQKPTPATPYKSAENNHCCCSR